MARKAMITPALTLNKQGEPLMKSFTRYTAIIALLLTLAGCGAATQNIPVSTDPSGATLFVDGKETCTTPCNASLEKTQDHIITIQKEGYKQVDVQITRQYDTVGVARDATQSGMSAASTGASTEGAIANALLATGYKEEQGSAYVLTPSTVTVKLAANGASRHSSQTAETSSDAPIVITRDQLAPEDQQAVIKTTQPTTLGSTLEENPEKAAEALLEAGAAAAPTIHTSKKTTNSHSSETYGNDGSFTKKTTSTSASVGVSVNPVEAGLGVLHLLEEAGKEKDPVENE